MRRVWLLVAIASLLGGLGWPVSAGDFVFIEQSGAVSVTADGNTVTETLPRFQQADISLTAGTPEPGRDYAVATAVSAVHGNEIHLTLSAGVGEWGNEGKAEARIAVVFSVDQNTSYIVELEKAEATGSGWLGARAFISLSDDRGEIFRRHVSGGYESCNRDHPDYTTLCKNRILTPGVYSFEMVSSAYAPTTCGSCQGYAVTSRTELKVTR